MDHEVGVLGRHKRVFDVLRNHLFAHHRSLGARRVELADYMSFSQENSGHLRRVKVLAFQNLGQVPPIIVEDAGKPDDARQSTHDGQNTNPFYDRFSHNLLTRIVRDTSHQPQTSPIGQIIPYTQDSHRSTNNLITLKMMTTTINR